ncbi:hypothetical protein [Virgisporangium aurantiacum]|uniref:Uncharacterized protein n=1 Tax=Virgisporangium aurantiacum TaxID=175570 RepID=A0A8J4E515_9ACTN|nr:hypothetical protein [Virgisporangium aurantiacum]GIJ61618.1 hypothetical protein Vau01_091340 [Virgisporangium aurantiacum]
MADPLADVVRLTPVPRIGDLFIDARGDGRAMRVSLHPDRAIAVVSLWSSSTCRASFQLPLEDAARLAELLSPAGAAIDAAADADAEAFEADHPYPGLADTLHITGSIVPPGLSQAS